LRDDPRPPFFEALPRHDAVLDGEETEQEGIDDERGHERSRRASVN
jgi:hypothetical protein